MPTLAEAHAALDLATATAFSGYNVYYKDQTVPEMTEPFIKQMVVFSRSSQSELGNSVNGRNRGSIIFIFHRKKGEGSSLLNTWNQILINTFRSKTIGGVVLQSVVSSNSGETEQWVISVSEVPFYFDS